MRNNGIKNGNLLLSTEASRKGQLAPLIYTFWLRGVAREEDFYFNTPQTFSFSKCLFTEHNRQRSFMNVIIDQLLLFDTE